MTILNIAKRCIRLSSLFLLVVLTAGVTGAFLYSFLLPRLSLWPLTARFAWPDSSHLRPTVIERTEQVVLSQEEGIERFSAAPRASVVSIIGVATEGTGRAQPAGGFRQVSGILVTNDGLVATYLNEAPLSSKIRYSVLFSDNTVSGATFVAYDPVVHVAYFQTERTDTPALAFANSSDIRQGRRFMILAGTTDVEEGKLSTGYIGEHARTFNLSAKTVGSTDEWEGVFFADHPIEAGFVGGAAVAMDGELIGLIGSLQLDGVQRSFLLPSNVLRQSLQRVIDKVPTSKVSIGAYYISLTKMVALSLRAPRDRGALIYTPSERSGLAVILGSVAERAGLRYGDIVTAVDGQEINLDRPLSVALYDTMTSPTTVLTVLRAGNELSITLSR